MSSYPWFPAEVLFEGTTSLSSLKFLFLVIRGLKIDFKANVIAVRPTSLGGTYLIHELTDSDEDLFDSLGDDDTEEIDMIFGVMPKEGFSTLPEFPGF